MMVKLLVNQIPRAWPFIKACVKDVIPDFAKSEEKLSNLLKALMLGEFHCWIIADESLKAMVITTITHDGGSGTSNLLVYCLRAFGEMTKRDWAEGFITLKKFAQSNGCKYIVGYTNNNGVLSLVRRFGGDTTYTFVSIPI